MKSPKKRKVAGPILVRPGSRLTGTEFYAKALERRGTRAPLDNALAAARDALEGKLKFIARAYVEEAQAIVRSALADDPLGVKPLTPRVMEACRLLEHFSAVARTQAHMQTEHDWLTMPYRQQIEYMLAICSEHGWSPHKRGVAKKIAPKMDVTEREVRRYLRIFRAHRS
jgi:hypothetical protein